MTSMRTKFNVGVLFEDYSGLWSPLDRLYFSSSSKVLVSRHPLLTTEEVISTYCPQCLTRYTEEEALVFNSKCPQCFRCPSCEGIMVKTSSSGDNSQECNYICTTCAWNCNHPAFDSKKAFETASKGNIVFQGLLKHLQHFDQGFNENQTGSNADFKKPWHLDDLEKKVVSRQTSSLHGDYNFPSNEPIPDGALPPVAMALRSKRTVRCRRDLDAGKMNILVQPKPSPLDGDSSMRVQKGKWWVKDSCAVHELPFFSVLHVPQWSDLREGKRCMIFVRIVNSHEQSGRIILRVRPDISYGAYYMMDDLGQARSVQTSSFTALRIITNENPAIVLDLEGYEDELLKDEHDLSEGLLDVATLIRTHVNNNSDSNWVVKSVANQAVLGIPITLPDQDSISPAVELDLSLSWEREEASISTSVKICVSFEE